MIEQSPIKTEKTNSGKNWWFEPILHCSVNFGYGSPTPNLVRTDLISKLIPKKKKMNSNLPP